MARRQSKDHSGAALLRGPRATLGEESPGTEDSNSREDGRPNGRPNAGLVQPQGTSPDLEPMSLPDSNPLDSVPSGSAFSATIGTESSSLVAAKASSHPSSGQAAGKVQAASLPQIDADRPQRTQQFVTFVSGDEVFAADMSPVKEIIRLPEVVRVPLAPAALAGLANLRGKVLPILSLRRLLGLEDLAPNDSTRALIVDVGQPIGFVVDRVSSVIGVDMAQIEGVGSISATVDTEMLSGLIRNVGSHAMVMVLDFRKLIAREFSEIASLSGSTNASGGEIGEFSVQTEESCDQDELHLVSFLVNGQEYAIGIEEVQEIVQVPEEVIHVPHSQSHVLGVMTLRSRLLPLVNLRTMFALPFCQVDEKSRVVVLTLGGVSAGVVVDAVSEVLRVSRGGVDALPALLAREGNLAEITSICRLDAGKRMVSIMTVRNLFGQTVFKEAMSVMQGTEEDSVRASGEAEDHLEEEEQIVVFRLAREEFGAPIANVQEIVRVPEQLIRIPQAPSFVEGVINLRGSVLPVVDLRLRLGLNQVDRSDGQRIMVFLISGVRTGFIVDEVAEVLKVAKVAIEPSPRIGREQNLLLSRMANLERQKRMVQLIDPPYLMQRAELAALTAVTG